ncbi:MAG: hypothetical protein ACM34K_12505 [Bacillota bacterium]
MRHYNPKTKQYEKAKKKTNKKSQSKFGKFNVSTGAKTMKGPLHITRLISKEHSNYSQYFNEDGTKKETEIIEERKDDESEKKENIA